MVLAGGAAELSANFHVVLSTIGFEVQTVAAGDFFREDIYCLSGIVCSCVVETIHLTVEVVVAVVVLLEHEELISNASLGLGNDFGNQCGGERICRIGCVRAGVLPGVQSTTLVELHSALIVDDPTGNGDCIAYADLVSAGASHTVALNGLLGLAINDHGNSHILVLGAILRIDLGDHAGQGALVCQCTTLCQCVSVLQNLLYIFRCLHCFAGNYLVQNAAGIKLDRAIVILDDTGNGNGIAGLQILSAVALQAIAHNGLVLSAFHCNGNSDVLVIVAPCGIDLCNDTGQCHFVAHGFAGLQCVSLFHNGYHIIGGSGQQVVPAVGNAVAGLVSDGSGQNVLNVFLHFLIDVDGYHAIGALDDLNDVVVHIDRPNDFIVHTVNRHIADTGEVLGGLFRNLLVDSLDILKCCLQVGSVNHVNSGCGSLFVLSAAGKQAQAHCQKKDPCNYSFHGYLLFVY